MRRSLNIAWFGSSLLSAYWNGAATYYRGIVAALARLGHRVTFYEPDAYERQAHRDLDPPSWARAVVYPAAGTDGVDECLRDAARAEVVIKASGVGVHDAYLETEVLKLRRPGNAILFWDVDAPATLDRVQADPSDPFRPLIGRYDAVLTYGGGPPVVNAYRALGAQECVPIYNALDPSTHHPPAQEPTIVADLAFLGNRLPDREERVEEFFIRVAEALPARRFLLGGSGWGDRRLPPNVAYLGHVYTADHNDFNRRALAVLNINRDSMARYGYSPATRVFEAAGSAACLITDAWQGIDTFLEPGREVLVAHQGHDVTRLVDELTPSGARMIGRAALERVRRQHTYDHRAVEVDAIISELVKP